MVSIHVFYSARVAASLLPPVCVCTHANVLQWLPWGQCATAERWTWPTMQMNIWWLDYCHYVGIIPKVLTSDNMHINSTIKHWARCSNYLMSSCHLSRPAGHMCHLLAQKMWQQEQTEELAALRHLSVYAKTTDEGAWGCWPASSSLALLPHPSIVRAAMGSMCEGQCRLVHMCTTLPTLPALLGLGF